MIRHKKTILIVSVAAILALVVAALIWDRRYVGRYLTIVFRTAVWSDPLYRREPLEVASGHNVSMVQRRPNACLESLRRDLSSHFEKHQRLGFLIGRNGKVVFEDYAAGASQNTQFNVFGVHLGIVGLLTGTLIRDGSIDSVDAPVSRYISEWAGDSRGQISVRQLLQMSSGLEKFADTFSPFARALRSELGSDVLDVSLTLKSISKPGHSFYYSGRNVDLLVHVLERASGMRYTDILSNNLLKPANAGSALVWLDRPGGHAEAGRSLYIRLPDLYQLVKAFVDPEQRLVPEGWIDFMKSPSLANPHFGAGVWLGLSASPERPNVQSAVQHAVDLHANEYDDIFFLAGFGGQRVYLMQQMHTVVIFVGRAQSDWNESAIPDAVGSALAMCDMGQHSG